MLIHFLYQPMWQLRQPAAYFITQFVIQRHVLLFLHFTSLLLFLNISQIWSSISNQYRCNLALRHDTTRVRVFVNVFVVYSYVYSSVGLLQRYPLIPWGTIENGASATLLIVVYGVSNGLSTDTLLLNKYFQALHLVVRLLLLIIQIF